MSFRKNGTIQTDGRERAKYSKYIRSGFSPLGFLNKGKGISPVLLAAFLSFGGLSLPVMGETNSSENPGQDFTGLYHVLGEEESTLRIGENKGEEGYHVQLDLYRLISLDFDARQEEDLLKGSFVPDEEMKGIEIEFQREKGEASGEAFIQEEEEEKEKEAAEENQEEPIVLKAKITSSDWELLEEGEEFLFTPALLSIPEEVFPHLFTQVFTGFEGTAGASLKEALAAEALIETSMEYQLSLQDRQELIEALRLARGQAPETLDANLSSILELAKEALQDYDSVKGLFEDAGVSEFMGQAALSPFAKEDLMAFEEAYSQAKEG